jgi:restriction system protein
VTAYYRLMLGQQSIYSAEAFAEGYIGADFDIDENLTGHLPDDVRSFNEVYIPKFLQAVPGKSKVAAGLACGSLWVVCKGMALGDIVLCPDGSGTYHVGKITGDYFYVPDTPLQHRRPVEWLSKTIARVDMSEDLKRSTGSIGTYATITKHAAEIEAFLSGSHGPVITTTDPDVLDPSVFALEKHLEDFLIANWQQTPLAATHRIYEVDGQLVGQQYPSDTGPIDILAISHDGTELLVVELKRGRASDAVVGQIQRYMGYVQSELAEPGQTVRGIIIALEDDLRVRRALTVAPNIDFYRYEVKFALHKA